MSAAADSRALELAFAYLAAADALPAEAADVVLGLGHFDRTIPRLCAELALAGRARWIVFSGGVGAGSGDFTQAEALEFRDDVRRHWPAVEARIALLETRSTNTGENLAFTTAALAAARPDLRPGDGLRSAIVVATPCRLRRALATVRRHWPEVRSVGTCAVRSLAEEEAFYARHGLALRTQVAGEFERLASYPARGFMAPIEVPADVWSAARQLGAKV
ncbi:MAG: YdcF family protein [Candidatus Didemnitutus sp.]|nr:YdcF family protein [Candidatus Didemnitutus sp.]